ncbi:MAG: RNA-binding transcriptional accessory protein [Planctomycetes bacterium]|nr:RNA-binding transcriptional accessory protein [Planctomycetota bacterium]
MELNIIEHISQELKISKDSVESTIQLLDDGNTIPFITRYRKEVTNGLDEEQIRNIQEKVEYWRNLEKRKQEILARLQELKKDTPELCQQIKEATKLKTLEDLYLPYRPKRRTKATIAKENGLSPLAEYIIKCDPQDPEVVATTYISDKVPTCESALQGAVDIATEYITEDIPTRELLRKFMQTEGMVVVKKVKKTMPNEQIYQDYFDFQQLVSQILPHRILAIDRGEKEKILSVTIELPDEKVLQSFYNLHIKETTTAFSELKYKAVKESYKNYLSPAISREIRNELTEKAHLHAVNTFTANLHNLLLQPPMNDLKLLAIDPGYVSGCKLAVLSKDGDLLEYGVMFPHQPQNKKAQAKTILQNLYKKHIFHAIAIGNGTASRETEELVSEWIQESNADVRYTIVSEAGASVFSASEVARAEFPDLDASYRGTISIGRRLLDPLAEFVKIDTKSLGIGMYQHDINAKLLEKALYTEVESIVNYVGVDVNRASPELLQYIAGLNKRTAKNIVEHRKENGRFQTRQQLKDVSGIGIETFKQCAGFLRIPQGENLLDNTSIHPENYDACEQLLELVHGDSTSLPTPATLQEKIQEYTKETLLKQLNIGKYTLDDIIENLQKPGRDPRESVPPPVFRKGVISIDNLQEDMILDGTVRNVVDFGAFVDIGVHIDGLVHISEMSTQFTRNPFSICKVGDNVKVRILSIDKTRNRISLSFIL